MADTSADVRIIALTGIPEVHEGDDLLALILRACETGGTALEDGDVLVVTHKVVSKAEGRIVDLRTVAPSALAERYGRECGKDPRYMEVVLRESARIVRMDRGILISQTPHGFVCANAGVDNSNVPGDDTVCLLPVDPDRSARSLRDGVRAALGTDVAVLITDSFGRPWRDGITNVTIGVAGMRPLVDYRGQIDVSGKELNVSVMAAADELAAAAELVMGKIDARPVAIIRGYEYQPAEGTYRDLVMAPERDMFR